MSHSQFKPAWWLVNPHLQTIWPSLFRKNQLLPIEPERLELPDGDFIDLVWVGKQEAGPIVLLLHGFEGSIHSHYIQGMMLALHQAGWRAVLMHFRGCSGEPNRLPQGYHSGETTDLAYCVSVLKQREKNTLLGAIGYSLGGNVLLKWLGETGTNNPLDVAIAVSVPFELHKAICRIESGFSRLYQWYFLKGLRERLTEKFSKVPTANINIDINRLPGVQSLREFDNEFTAPFYGFLGADDYYQTASSRQYLRYIKVPTLIVHAKDDPFMTTEVIPETHELSPFVQLEVTERGGHVGFITGRYPWKPQYWLEQRLPDFLKSYLVPAK